MAEARIAFPPQLQLPGKISLNHITASDLSMLAAGVKSSPSMDILELHFDSYKREQGEDSAPSRTERQTRHAMSSMVAAIKSKPSLEALIIFGPGYKLFDEEAWKALLDYVQENRLKALRLNNCNLGDSEVLELCSSMRGNTGLVRLSLDDNDVTDVGAHALIDVLKDNTSLQLLDVSSNSNGEESQGIMKAQLAHIKTLLV